jgi:uncharacterized protein (DUF58 family)
MKGYKTTHHFADSRVVVLVSVCMLLLWLFSSNILLFIGSFCYLLLIGTAHGYVHYMRSVQVDMKQENNYLFVEESDVCQLRFYNSMRFPAFLTLSFRSDEGMDWNGAFTRTNHFYQVQLELPPRAEKRVDLTGIAKKRGTHTWQNVQLTVTDPFNLVNLQLQLQIAPVFHVFPRMKKVRIPETKRWRYGYRSAIASPLLDEMKIIGVKAYEQEAFRSIHWGATAKTGVLSAKKLEPVQADRYAVYLNLVGQHAFMLRPDAEELIEFTAGTCKQLLEMDCSFELWVNSVQGQGVLHIGPGLYRRQLYKVLQLLATLTVRDTPLPSKLFYQTGFRRQQVDAIPLIIGRPPEEVRNWLQVAK